MPEDAQGARGLAPGRVLRTLYARARGASLTVSFTASLFDLGEANRIAMDLETNIQGKSDFLIGNLQAMYDECRRRRIRFIVANQQGKSWIVPDDEMVGVSYQDELELVRRKLSDEGEITGMEMRFATHAVLMDAAESWAETEGVPFVDVIDRLDASRGVLHSEVHLSPEGNVMVAEALADEILGAEADERWR